MKKIVSILVMITLAYTGLIMIVDNNINVQGISGGNGEESFNNFYDYIWFNITSNLSYVVHNDSIWGEGDEVIRKGRSFGTPGDNWTAKYIEDELNLNLGLENVQKLPLGPIADKPNWSYTSKVETINYNLTCNSQDFKLNFTSDGHIPKNESFAMPSGWKNNSDPNPDNWSMNYNNTFDNIKLVPKDYSDKLWFYHNALTSDYHNLTNITELKVFFDICGSAKYIPINQNLSSLQIGKVFLLEEENGCENQLDNITTAFAAILIHNNTQGG